MYLKSIKIIQTNVKTCRLNNLSTLNEQITEFTVFYHAQRALAQLPDNISFRNTIKNRVKKIELHVD